MNKTYADTDFFSRALRQGASRYIALVFEAYVHACWDADVKPASCAKFLSSIDYSSTEDAVNALHASASVASIASILRATERVSH